MKPSFVIAVDAANADAAKAAERREYRRKERIVHHTTMLLLSVAVVGLSFALRIGSEGQVEAGRWTLPPLCMSQSLFGTKCPGCGLTRSFVALAAGNWRESVAFHRLGWLLFGALLASMVYRCWMLRQLRHRLVELRWPAHVASAIIVALCMNWIATVLGIVD